MSQNKVPKTQRALVFQGGGALGAYDAGVFRALYKEMGEKEGFDKMFDIVAGTSSGAMNGAILVSHVVEHGTWEGSHDKLDAFWKYVSTDVDLRYWYPYISDKNNWISQWNIQKLTFPNLAEGEVARRYYSAKQFLCSGVPNVYLPQFSTPCQPFNGLPRQDDRFLDNFSFPNNTWYVYTNHPLKESLAKFAKFPIATNFEGKQPRLLLVSVDVQEGAVVTFDSYPKDENGTIRESWYGSYDRSGRYEYTISYPDGIRLDYAMASGSVPINYDYAKIADVDKLGNSSSDKITRYFWDGGILSNTPLRELIQWHKDYWFRIMGKEADTAPVPDLEVYIVDVWPTKEQSIPWDRDGALDRKEDILLNDKTDYDEKVANIVSDYVDLVKELMQLAKDNNIPNGKIRGILSKTAKSSKHRTGQPRLYKDLINGRFNINVKRIERTKNVEYDIWNKMLDYSTDTIQHLIQDGYDDARKSLNS